jgi:ribonuclease inhibitor
VVRRELVEIDVTSLRDAQELHRLLQSALHFPDWYGQNWDAFWDAITGFVSMPRTLKIVGWSSLATHLPRDAQLLRQCLTDMMAQHPKEAPLVIYA